MSKLWGGRFSESGDGRFARFNASLAFDQRLLDADLRTAAAHAQSLRRLGLLTEVEAAKIQEALRQILLDVRESPQPIQRAIEDQVEDVHSFVEGELVRRLGDLGQKLNAGRSRNDQVVTDTRLYLRDGLDGIQRRLQALQEALLALAESHPQDVLPGYTHLQPAQPLLLAHYLLAYFEMFDRDRERLDQARARINVCPLGSAALAGSGYPLDRREQARALGFEGISRNSLDAVSDRDFVVEFCADACLVMTHLSRLCADLILYSSLEFGFVELSERVSTGSSLLPQKKNPDSLELIRGKCARLLGRHTALVALLQGLPLGYFKDLQEDKEALFDTLDTLDDCLVVMDTVLRSVSFQSDRMRQAASRGYTNATELADYLASKGLPFRQAHEAVGRAVREALERGCPLQELSLEDYKRISPLFESDLYEVLSLEAALASKNLPGGTAPEQVAAALREARHRLQGRG